MKYYRYMSLVEFVTMLQGDTIVSSGRCKRCNTSSDGVCFIGEHTDVVGYDYSPVECYEFLSGIVTGDILVEFESSVPLNSGIGEYALPVSLCTSWDDYYGRIFVQEYYIDQYSMNDLVPVAFYLKDKGNRWNWIRTALSGNVRIPVAYGVFFCTEWK